MKKSLLLILLFLSSKFYSLEKPSFRLICDFNIAPFFYEYSFNLRGIELNGKVFGGVNLRKFTLGVNIEEKYYSFSPMLQFKNLQGAFSIFKATFDTYFRPAKWIELRFGIGGGWLKSAFNYSNIGWISYSLGGLSFVINSKFKPQWKGFKYIDIDVFTHIDLFFNISSPKPYFIGGIRFNFHPFLKWINLYLETTAQPWQYSDDLVEINTAMFVWKVGISVDLIFPQVISKMRVLREQYKNLHKKKEIEEVMDLTNDIVIEGTHVEETIYDKLAKSNIGQVFSFPKIRFKGKTTDFNDGAYKILDELFDMMQEYPDISIAISGYSDFSGKDMSEELALSMKRAKKIKTYLEQKGIESKRLKILASGQLAIEIQRIK